MAEHSMKQRIVGAVVLISLAVIFIPMLLDSNRQYDRVIVKTNIPPKPRSFNSKIVPLGIEKVASVNPQVSKKPLVPTVSPAIKPLKQATSTASVKTKTAKTEGANKTASKPAPTSVTKNVTTSQTPTKKETPKRVATSAATDDNSIVTAIDKSTQLARVEPVVSGRPLTVSGPTSAGAPMTDNSGKSLKSGVVAWAVQVGSFGQEKNANALRDKLRKQGYASFVERIYSKSSVSYRVRIGPELDRKKAEKLRDKLASNEKLKGIVVRYP